jgi:hypothetical protein
VDDFLKAIPEKYKFIEINLNSFNQISENSFQTKFNSTYQLDLVQSYENIQKNYSTNTKRNLQKALKCNLRIINSVPVLEVITLFRENLKEKLKKLKEKHYAILNRTINISIQHGFGQLYGVYNLENNLIAAAFFISSHNKTIFLLSVSNDEGKEKGAMFLLIDKFIENNNEKTLTLDFEGSNIPGLARFYAGFGAEDCKYLSIKQNRLPWYIKLFKN